ncbi:protein-export chaperone SecB [Leuconostoc gasicomitatum]|uniref:Protein-export chaperone SecB n=1 Tax=Leuconostoc gasicomitatum TaxID=115778 RepID=A0A9Q3SVR3_9LACO|nr:protein-export chaperone SecB [Leuconostoc gasicomitatum]MBZ5962660.1 protein-export chaperone SecB [Leuconostoc gasicomitatum]
MAEEQTSFRFTSPQLSNAFFSVRDRGISDNPKDIISNVKIISSFNERTEEKAVVSLTVQNFDNSDDIEGKAYIFNIEYTAEFVWENNLDSQKVDEFLNVSAPALLLSYVRTTLSNMTSSAKVKIFDLPFFDFTQKSNNSK